MKEFIKKYYPVQFIIFGAVWPSKYTLFDSWEAYLYMFIVSLGIVILVDRAERYQPRRIK